MISKYVIPVVINEKEKRSNYDVLIEGLKPISELFHGNIKIMHRLPVVWNNMRLHQSMVIEISFPSAAELNGFLHSGSFQSVCEWAAPRIIERSYIIRNAGSDYTQPLFDTAG